jgi:hypothetical protein
MHLTIDDLKRQAKRLRADLGSEGETIGHGKSLELVAHQYGYKDWNTIHAAIGNAPNPSPVTPGQRVTGRYLGHPFVGEVIGVQLQTALDKYRVTLKFEEPVDVVTFDSFSNFRQRVSCTVDRHGRTVERISNGHHHLVLDL